MDGQLLVNLKILIVKVTFGSLKNETKKAPNIMSYYFPQLTFPEGEPARYLILYGRSDM